MKKHAGYYLDSKTPKWIKQIKNVDIRNLVEQEYYINALHSKQIAKAKTLDEAKKIRSALWNR